MEGNLVGSEGYVGAVDDGVAFDGVVRVEVGDVAVVDRALVGAEVEAIAEAEEEVRGRRRHCRALENEERDPQNAEREMKGSFHFHSIYVFDFVLVFWAVIRPKR